ncbi:iron-sulfur cluster assembly 2 homolog, mitochondrial-like isoform X2 [Pollicipes pollicipes]|uniref:iron-sulfur cluster assembly 2 homolog, mitochondrial-like isoform X2 n=1 Tax=Pollicipes pollicipes TaxID=41117 RepID=UPI00188493BE|nr:iron-sulfur cluster assembly 2 homolog, mitochondrial-like isoform X2 [Pollicipes pollicipes]
MLARLSSTASRSAASTSPPSASSAVSASAPSASSAAASPADGSDDPGGVRLSEACVHQLRRLAADGSCLRLAVDGGGCSGFQYVFSLAEAGAAPQPDDAVLERDGARVLVDHVSLGYIRGATIDYHEELIRSAFRIVDNPQSEQGCSCGASFSIKID